MTFREYEPGTPPPPNFPRYASIDIGTNTVKLTIAALGPDGSFHVVKEAGATPRLGEGIASGCLSPAAMQRTLSVLTQAVAICAQEQVEDIAAVGTAALRQAANKDEFLAQALQLGLQVHVLTGAEEGRLSALAVRSESTWRHWPTVLVMDVGGGSTEIIRDELDPPSTRIHSLPVGGVRITERHLRSDPTTPAEVTAARDAIRDALRSVPEGDLDGPVVAVGGTLNNMGMVYLNTQKPADRTHLHGLVLPEHEIERQVTLYASMPIEQRRNIPGLDPSRADVILAGALIVQEVLRATGRNHLAISVRGLRWGVLYDRFGRKVGADGG